MNFVSTRNPEEKVSIQDAIQNGLASDGGLYVPEKLPQFSLNDFKHAKNLSEIAQILLKPFFADHPFLKDSLPQICEKTFQFPIPLTAVPKKSGEFVLELYHGPTSAFKDVGACFLANVMEVLIANSPESQLRKTVLVATSGDTGGAVAGAFFGKPKLEVVILYPEGKISARQEKQLCAWGGNIHAYAVKGNFDDCQRIVKEALLEQAKGKAPLDREWLSANSINLGRILPQMVYYAYSAIQLPSASFVIPTGNLGNAMAAVWVKKMGLPISEIHLAMNANRGVVDFLETGKFQTHATLPTLANAMDVSTPSNLERLRNLYPDVSDIQKFIHAESVSDDEIREAIQTSEKEWGQVFCPHTAVAGVVRKRNEKKYLATLARPWIVVSTAHPAKFESIVEPLIGKTVSIPKALAEILQKPSEFTFIGPTYSSFLESIASLKASSGNSKRL